MRAQGSGMEPLFPKQNALNLFDGPLLSYLAVVYFFDFRSREDKEEKFQRIIPVVDVLPLRLKLDA